MLQVGMDANWVPFEYLDGSGQLSGFDVGLARELGRRLRLEVQFVANLSFDGLYDALTAGRADAIISAMVVDRGRGADFFYSTPYFDAGQVLVVGPDSADVDGMKDLTGRVLAVELGSDGDTIARRWERRLTDLALLRFDSADGALSAVADGQADAALTDRATALMALKANHRRTTGTCTCAPLQRNCNCDEGGADLTGLHIGGGAVTGEQYAIAVRREGDGLLHALNAVLAEMQRDGTLKELERKWLGP